MRVDEEIYVVFHLMPGAEGRPQEIGVPADPLFCWVSGAYYKDENIRDTLVAEKYESLFGIGPIYQHNFLGPFHSSDELKRFFYLLSEELKASRVRLITFEKFDELAVNSNTTTDLWNKLEEEWDTLENVDKNPESNLLEKIFNRK